MAHTGETNLDHLDFEMSTQPMMTPEEEAAYIAWMEREYATVEAREKLIARNLEETGF